MSVRWRRAEAFNWQRGSPSARSANIMVVLPSRAKLRTDSEASVLLTASSRLPGSALI
jgi:hypothetical protein